MTPPVEATVLIVDDEFDIRLLVRTILQASELGLEVVGEATDGIEALEVFDRLDPPRVPDVVILDNRMPGRDGTEVADEMLRRAPAQKIVLFSAHPTPELEQRALGLGVQACLGKSDFAALPQLVADLAASG